MIRVDRHLPAPAALSRAPTSGPNRGKSEAQLVLERWELHQAQLAALPAGATPPRFTFDYQRYKEGEVKEALTLLFLGKCAYCEVRYATSQPMDVEHWRPKGEVHLDDGTKIEPGYYWLASDWDNLLPSCIDCNRARQQHDVVEQRLVTLGKANQFPLLDETTRRRRHDLTIDELPSIVNPCLDDPETFFAYTDEGVIVPRATVDPARRRAQDSIRVYALNRSDLVAERRELIRLIDHRLELVRQLGQLRSSLLAEGRDELAEIVEELLSIEIDALRAMTSASRPFAGVARFFLAEEIG